ncbi:alpha/beta hydrolase [Candidatus Poriferisocius sp.]|uniref:alpha/beta hydrolase n=1 Tax=Candidatus Poriferisocius sp. TaxID=3101276 RepID=UPI003B025B82
MKLWDEEIESYRAEAKALLDNLPLDQFQAEEDTSDDPMDHVLAQRELLIQFEPEPSPMAEDSAIPGPAGDIPVRLYIPDNPKAMFLHIHGGGWYTGRPKMSEEANVHIATQHGLALLSVDYRLAPEHPFPAGPDDCEAAAAWMLEHGPKLWGTEKMFIGGESAGGHLSAVTLLRVRDRLGAVDRVLGANLVFGMYDFRGTPSFYGNGGRPDVLTPEGLQQAVSFFIPGLSESERRNPDLSPLFADLSGLPPCLISTGTFDHIADDSYFLAVRMAAAESPVELAVYPDSPHGFVVFPTEMNKAHERRIDAWIASLLAQDA